MTNAEARCNKSLRPRKPEGSLGRTAQDVHLDSHTAPELCTETGQALSFTVPHRAAPASRWQAASDCREGGPGRGGGDSGPVTRASLHSSPATVHSIRTAPLLLTKELCTFHMLRPKHLDIAVLPMLLLSRIHCLVKVDTFSQQLHLKPH